MNTLPYRAVRYIVTPLTLQVESMRSETLGRCHRNGKTHKEHAMHRIVLLLVLSEHLGKGFLQELNEEVGYGQIDHVWSRKPTENDGHSDTHTHTDTITH